MRRRVFGGSFCPVSRVELMVGALLLAAGVSVGQMVVGQNFWDMSWGLEKTNPFVTTMNTVSGSNPWKPLFLEECAPYHILRFMDWNVTNDLEKEEKLTIHRGGWEARRKMSDARQKPLAYEWQIDLCNRLACDYWLNVPSVVDSTYQYELAKLIKAQLNPALKVYIEWSNEVWNTNMTQTAVAESMGVLLGFPPAGKPSQQGWSYSAWRSLLCFEQFEKVFGKNSPRIVKIIPSWANGPGCTKV